MIRKYAYFSSANVALHRFIVLLVLTSFFGLGFSAAFFDDLSMFFGSLLAFPAIAFFAKASKYKSQFIAD